MTQPETTTVADAVRGNWVDRYLPAAAKPYARMARLDRPIGWWLLLWPCWWSAALAADFAGRAFPDPWHLVLFFIGAVAMRGAGCIYNDIVDRDLDAEVARTRSRPIPSGQISVRNAVLFLAAQALVGLVVLLQFNGFAIVVGFASLLAVAIYPFLKRVTDWPQLGLGIAFSWGAFMGWAALLGDLGLAPVLLYVGCIAWTIGYDTIYAHQDREDDTLVGVRSTARLFGARTKPYLTVFYGLAVALFAAAFVAAGTGTAAYVGLAAAAVHLGWQVVTLDIDDPDRCLMLFRSNRDTGWILFAGLLIDAWLTAA
ncbi:4-hydroxybenzoate octaprenyltransferase [Bauldia sp.]|uniref:4-hydroxybenzoate octaprenyltransferase n=1 Tax=Bauldia sp. TaxID=2575872 RepID=UPI003BACA51C